MIVMTIIICQCGWTATLFVAFSHNHVFWGTNFCTLLAIKSASCVIYVDDGRLYWTDSARSSHQCPFVPDIAPDVACVRSQYYAHILCDLSTLRSLLSLSKQYESFWRQPYTRSLSLNSFDTNWKHINSSNNKHRPSPMWRFCDFGAMISSIGDEACWAVARPLFVPSGQAVLLAVPLFCVQIDFSSISYWTPVGIECKYRHAILKTVTE